MDFFLIFYGYRSFHGVDNLGINKYRSTLLFHIFNPHKDTLINDNLSVGKHSIQWDASNYSSGVYFIKLECENYYNMRKMLLLK